MKNQKSGQRQKKFLLNIVLIALVIALTAWPLLTLKDAEFAGADGEAKAEITKIDQDYVPWFESLFEPASSEIEGLLFALQAALGAGVLGFGLGYLKGKKKQVEDKEE